MRIAIALAVIGGCAALATSASADGTGACALPGYVSAGRPGACHTVRPPAQSGDALGIVDSTVGSIIASGVDAAVREMDDLALTGAAGALRITDALLSGVTRPTLGATWFSDAYWRVATIAALLTVPFLCAAAVHALVRSDLALLGRAVFGYLPLGLLGVSIAAPLTTLFLTASDEMSSFVAGAAGDGDSSFLAHAAAGLTSPSLIHGQPFVAFLVALLTIAAAVGLWIELLVRAAAVDVIVLMLPLFFAAMVWPARRVWAIRAIETLVALILSKFAIIAVLALGGAALSQLANGPAALLTGATLILLATLSPWVLLRLLPLHEVAAAAAGGLSGPPREALRSARSLIPVPGSGDGGSREGMEGPTGTERPTPEDAEAPLQRVLSDRVGRAATAAGASAADEVGLTPGTQAGLRAIAGAGGGHATPPGPGAAPLAETGGPRDGRPPLPPPFDGGRWEGFVLGDGAGERMQPPRIVPPRGSTDGGEDVDGGPADDPGPDAAEPPPPNDEGPSLDPPPDEPTS